MGCAALQTESSIHSRGHQSSPRCGDSCPNQARRPQVSGEMMPTARCGPACTSALTLGQRDPTMPTSLTQKMRLYISFPQLGPIKHCHITFSGPTSCPTEAHRLTTPSNSHHFFTASSVCSQIIKHPDCSLGQNSCLCRRQG